MPFESGFESADCLLLRFGLSPSSSSSSSSWPLASSLIPSMARLMLALIGILGSYGRNVAKLCLSRLVTDAVLARQYAFHVRHRDFHMFGRSVMARHWCGVEIDDWFKRLP